MNNIFFLIKKIQWNAEVMVAQSSDMGELPTW